MSAVEPHVLAVDLGTSGPKAAVVALDGSVVAMGRSTVPTHHLADGGVEQDPEAVWAAVREACGQALRDSRRAAAVRAVICTSQYSSVVPVDRDGRAIAPMVLWLDHRGATARLRRQPAFPRLADAPWRMLTWLRIHGLPPVDGGLSLTHLRWFKYARPALYERTAKFLEPMDYLTLRFSGRAVANQATAFMFLATDNRRLDVTDYDPRLLRHSLIDREKLPDLVPLDAILGPVLPDVAGEFGLPPDAVVVTGLNDTQAGGMGSGAFTGPHASISIGSTSVMITHVPFKRTDVRHAILSMPSPAPDTWFVMAENGAGGSALEHVLKDLVRAEQGDGERPDAARHAFLEQAIATTPPGSGGVLFLPWMGGSLAPAADSRMRGGFLNLGLDTTRAQLARAVLEGVALNLRWLRGPVERFSKRRFTHFAFYGGGAQSESWSQILADVLGTPVHALEQPQYTTCRGAALLAFQRLGLLGFHDFPARTPTRRIYEPNRANVVVYDRLAETFAQAFHKTRPVFRALNRTEPTS